MEQNAKVALRVSMVYTPEKVEGFTRVEAHYLASATLPGGDVVTGAGRTHWAAITAIGDEAAKKLGLLSPCNVSWVWNTDGGATGRSNFPAGVESDIKAQADKEAKHAAETLAKHEELVAVAQEIMSKAAAPAGYAWRLVTPYDDGKSCDYNRGDRVWLYAEKGEDRLCLDIERKAVGGRGYYRNSGKSEIWIGGPGYGRDTKRCKANSKGDWVSKAAGFLTEKIAARKRDAEREVYARKDQAARKEREAAFCQAAGIADTSVRLGNYGDGSITVNAVREDGNVDFSVSNAKLLPAEAALVIALLREASARRIAADQVAQAARDEARKAAVAVDAAKAQG